MMLSDGFWKGARAGGQLGFIVAALYAGPFCALSALVTLILLDVTMLKLTLAISVLTIFWGLVPATLLGFLTGGMIGWLLQLWRKHSSRLWALVVGLFVSGAATWILNRTFGSALAKNEFVYLMVLGIPSGLYVVTSVGLALELTGRVAEATSVDATLPRGSRAEGSNRLMLIAGAFFTITSLLLIGVLGISPVSKQPDCYAATGFCAYALPWILVAITTGVATLVIYKGGRQVNGAPLEPGPA